MSIVGTVAVACPACKRPHEARLVQSVNTRTAPDLKQQLLAGELNAIACECGKRTQLAATVLFHDPDAAYLCQVCPRGDAEMTQAAELFRASGATGTQRLVPSLNALVEKVKLLDAGLADWAIEMIKVLLLASIGERDLDRVVLFERVDRAAGTLAWAMFDARGGAPQRLASPLEAYEKLTAHEPPPPATELRIDRVWAVDAVRAMIARTN